MSSSVRTTANDDHTKDGRNVMERSLQSPPESIPFTNTVLSTMEYPTASTVLSSYFPYPTLYPQQRDLINTFLQSLQLIHERQQQQSSSSSSSSIGATTTTTTTRPHHTKPTTCPVYMLESPTGTGKSLSLACSAMAWLRYMEHFDLYSKNHSTSDSKRSPPPSSQNVPPSVTTKSTAAKEDNGDDDWIRNWVSPQERQQTNQQQQMIQIAIESRQSLQMAIQQIIITQQQQQQQVSTELQPPSHHQQSHVRIRQQLVREAVRDAQQQFHTDKLHGRNKKQIRRRYTAVPPHTNTTNLHHNKDDEFVLEQYHSDLDDTYHRDTFNKDMEDDDDDSDHEDHHHHKEKRTWTMTTAAAMSHRMSPGVVVAARHVLDGSALDGSKLQQLPNTGKQYSHRMDHNLSTHQQGISSSAAATTTTTIGQVKIGSGVRKIIYTARTHTQLSQFVREVRRCGGGGGNTTHQHHTTTKEDVVTTPPIIRVVHLGGRNNLCTHPTLTKKTNANNNERAITEACLDLQKGIAGSIPPVATNENSCKKRNKDQNCGCPMLEGREYTIPTLALHLQTEPTDIEETVQMGQASHTCAYYASRAALVSAEIVVLPYSMLLSKSTRESIGLSLKQALVIVDEAHNVPEALRSIHSCTLSLPIIQTALQQLSWYTQKYSDRMAGRNLFYLGQLRKILLSFQKHLNTPPSTNDTALSSSTTLSRRPSNENAKISGMMTATELLIDRKLDNVNLYRILRFLQHSRLSQKLLGYTNYKNKLDAANQSNDNNDKCNDGLSKHISAMSVVETFLEKLAFHGSDGKVSIDWPKQNVSIQSGVDGDDNDDRNGPKHQQHPSYRYVLLHPAAFFENVLEEAHALALVGGTLRPFVHVVAELLGDRAGTTVLNDAAQADQMASTLQVPNMGMTNNATSEPSVSNSFISTNFTAFTCDHVVPSSNVLLQCIGHGPTNQILDLRYQSRTNKAVCDELGRTLLHISGTVRNGVVVFLPSYSYESFLIRHWKISGIWNKIQAIKAIHREPKSSQYIEASLQSYARDAVHGPNGAILFSVIGGKMSEGINFSDDMARCVVVVGLPYPDITDPVLIEKMNALDNLPTDQAITGKSYYQSLCLRAVGQSVGRAIRHANDYAAIVLLDQRYCSDSRVWSGLPNWLKKGCKNTTWHDDIPFTKRLHEMKDFFDSKNSKQT